MPVVYTERIWSKIGTNIEPREGNVALEPDEDTSPSGRLGPICVANGLLKDDLAVFLSHNELGSSEEIGYLVTRVDKDGSGIIVGGDLFEQNPQTWINPRIKGLWGYLALHGYSPADFKLPELANYLAIKT